MAFLFGKKKSHERSVASREGHHTPTHPPVSRNQNEKSGLQHRGTPTGSLTSLDNDGANNSPDRGHPRRGASVDQIPPSENPPRNGNAPANNVNASLYPWSQRRLTYTAGHTSPFPRYGAAVNSISSKEGDVYMMGGLINSSTVKGDLWLIEAGGSMSCYPLATTAEGPGPRVGHASLLVGNAFIVYGGDTKIDESDVLDETLYLLNTSTRQWSRALPAGPRPAGRYGHSLNILGSKIFIFGGQVEDCFMNDLSAFDLNQLQMPTNRWEILVQGEASPKMPAPRTNHSMITYNDKLYLFGGTNGFQWFNDVWCYDAATNKWMQLDCIGYIPAPREGHAAALVDDVMYIFGGRTEEGTDLGDLAAFRISSRRWYTFQNMGPSPSPRSGHSMTTVGKSIVTIGGEPSSAATVVSDLGIVYMLDTTKIRYPPDSQQGQQGQPGPQRVPQGQRRPSLMESPNGARSSPVRDGSVGPTDQRRALGAPPAAAGNVPNGHRSPPDGADSPNGTPVNAPGSKPPRGAPALAGPPPSGPTPARPSVDNARGPGPSANTSPQASATRDNVEMGTVAVNGRRTPVQNQNQNQNQTQPVHPPRSNSKQGTSDWDGTRGNTSSRQGRTKGSIDSSSEIPKNIAPPPTTTPPPPTRQLSNSLSRRSSGRNSQTVVLLKELDSARNRNAWYASELELARKAGYVSFNSTSPVLDSRMAETFDDDDRPLIEALLAMRAELASVQNAVDKQASLAAKQVAEAEKQRDSAIQEAVYAKAKLAAQSKNGESTLALADIDRDDLAFRSEDFSKKFASSLHIQKDLQSRLDAALTELEAEKKSRQLADDTVNAAQKRLAGLETYKQQNSTEVERLKAELHATQREAREHSVASAQSLSALELLKVEKEDLLQKYDELQDATKDYNSTFESFRAAIAASDDHKSHLQAKLDEERSQREMIEEKLNNLKAEHEARVAELVATTQRLKDAEELAEKHANEAETHRQVILTGLDKITLRDESKAGKADTEHVTALQNQLNASSALAKKYQEEVDATADKLRSAEERIAGLEQYQEQSSREGLSIRRQLQSALRDAQSLQATNAELKSQLDAQQLETNAMNVQHNALKDILAERGVSPTSAGRPRGLSASPEQGRIRELETQLASANASHDETKLNFTKQAQESETAYREKLAQLEGDYQSAVHYVKGTEKMLKQLKDQLNRYKAENGQLKTEMEALEDEMQTSHQKSTASSEWEAERSLLQKKIETLETDLRTSGESLQKQLETVKAELSENKRQRDEAVRSSEDTTKKLGAQLKTIEQMRAENALLEQRANDAEQKVSRLLDQFEHSVDTYRRQSRQDVVAGVNGAGLGHARTESSELESEYGGNSEARNSTALDNLASELETLRSHWEATNKNYRLSNNFDFEAHTGKKDEDDGGLGLSESLADWRKKLDNEERASAGEKPRPV
ncbi:unnamed protein product [Clonostachys rosea f. rosea IK726]|uniref:Uncharacterized protein n=2 Tax=Bionectria ochroleuca TaxID=29856 RepID=A0A0B7KFL0_BIOOC|nr:unnamed protein product [Clonostachys rosea f. rosea IK726]